MSTAPAIRLQRLHDQTHASMMAHGRLFYNGFLLTQPLCMKLFRLVSFAVSPPPHGEVTRWRTPMYCGNPMFGNVTAPEGLHVTGKYRDRSVQHRCSWHAAWDPHSRAPLQARLFDAGSMKITTRLDPISHCKIASGTNRSNRWTHRVFIINTRLD